VPRTAPCGTGTSEKQGSTWLRWILCEAAQTAKRSPEFADTYQAIARRRGKKIATTAIARRLLTRVYHLLTDTEAAACVVATSQTPNLQPARVGPQTREDHHSPGELVFTHEPAKPRSMT
jgi:hypothetical protein